MKLKHFLTPFTKINSKWIRDSNVRTETIKLLEENIGKILSDINHSRILYDPPPRVMEIKEKINSSVQFSHSVMSDSLQPHESQHPGLPVHHQLPELTQTHVHRVSDAIQPYHPLSSPSPPVPNLSQH